MTKLTDGELAELKMFVFESEGGTDWIVAENKIQAISMFENITQDMDIRDVDTVREASPTEEMTYYHDLQTPETDTMENLIKKYCTKPDVFATSAF